MHNMTKLIIKNNLLLVQGRLLSFYETKLNLRVFHFATFTGFSCKKNCLVTLCLKNTIAARETNFH